MPPRPARPCNYPGCGTLVRDGTSRCERHLKRAWVRSDAPRRITGRPLQRLRRRLFAEQPLCVACLQNGFVREATVRDHVIALALGGTETEDNVQPLCKPCNDAKRAGEAHIGRRPVSGGTP
jgi:5-methylcytosine-specific restriction protein A